MKLSLISVIFLLVLGCQNIMAQITNSTKWANHRFDYSTKLSNNGFDLKGTASRGADWGTISLTKTSDNVYTVTKDGFETGITKAVYKTISVNGKNQGLLLFYNKDNVLIDMILENKNTKQLLVEPYRYVLLGDYVAKNGDHYSFSETNCTVNGKTYPYEFLEPKSDEENGDIFKFGDKFYTANLTLDGLELSAYKVTEHSYGREIEDLDETIELKAVDTKPRFSFMEKYLVIEKLYLPKKEFRVVINEIFARHGWTFNSDLKVYFSAKPWYKPLNDNSKIQLSDIEKLNVEILRGQEKMQD